MNEESKLEAIESYRQYSDCLPELLGVTLGAVGNKKLEAFLDVKKHHLNPAHTSCHAATMVGLADTACGWGCIAHLPEGASTFTTVDLTCNLLRVATSGVISCEASMLHGGRTTQIWDAIISDEEGHRLAAFRCTELIMY